MTASALQFPTVLLRHDLPDGSWHIDWLIGQDTAGACELIAFRLDRRPDVLAPGKAMAAERIVDHRPRYLDYEGPISGGRGVVERIARGVIEAWEGSDEHWRLQVRWASGRHQSMEIRREEDPRWRLTIGASTH